MQRNLINAAAIFVLGAGLFTGTARADDITVDTTPFVPVHPRAHVTAELQAFRAAQVNPWADDFNLLQGFRSDRTRQEVLAEFLAEREAVAALHSESGVMAGVGGLGARTVVGATLALRGARL